MTQPTKPPINPYLEDVIRTALEATCPRHGSESAEPRIVINGDRNVVAPGGVINIHVMGDYPLSRQEPDATD